MPGAEGLLEVRLQEARGLLPHPPLRLLLAQRHRRRARRRLLQIQIEIVVLYVPPRIIFLSRAPVGFQTTLENDQTILKTKDVFASKISRL